MLIVFQYYKQIPFLCGTPHYYFMCIWSCSISCGTLFYDHISSNILGFVTCRLISENAALSYISVYCHPYHLFSPVSKCHKAEQTTKLIIFNY
jgi:hypothetical protein